VRGAAQTLRAELVGLAGVVERNVYLVRRYIWWDLAFFVWTVANTLTIVFIAEGVEAAGGQIDVERTTTILLIGAVIWAYLGIIFEVLTETVAWERWEGTIEYTFMAPVPRVTHLLGMCGATLVRALGFSVAILAAVALFVPVDLSNANIVSAVVLLATGAVAFIGLAIAVTLRDILQKRKIGGGDVLGAVSGYILGGIVWGNLYVVLHLLAPGSFAVQPEIAWQLQERHLLHALFNFFSFATLTSLGYNDITPVTPFANTLTWLEVMFGQFYLAVVVAQLVGMRLAQAIQPGGPESK